jgi:membrane protease YdiL (CAAX protease family)
VRISKFVARTGLYNDGMSDVLFFILPILVVAWTAWGYVEHGKLKASLAAGERGALLREYRLTIAGLLVFGLLSLLAIGPGIFKVSPDFHITLPAAMVGAVWGLLIGIAASFVLLPLISRWTRRPIVVGDIQALLPQTPDERLLFVVVAVSAGVCEELLFRGFGLRLFEQAGLTGMVLLVVAAAAFGLAHIYQGVAGVLITFILGLLLSFAYVATGSLLLPMAIHTLIDLRILVLPTNKVTAGGGEAG